MVMAKRYVPAARGQTPVVVREAAVILGESERILRKQIAAGRYPLLAGPQSRERVLLPTEVVDDHARRRQLRDAPSTDSPVGTPPLVRYAMTPEAVARVADGVLRRHVDAIAGVRRELGELYEQRLAEQARVIAVQNKAIAELKGRVPRAEARAAEEAERHRALQERLVALVEAHASRSLVGQVNRLLQGERG
jgi:hypothetical protein